MIAVPFPHLLKMSRINDKSYLHIVSDTTPKIGEEIPLDKLGSSGYANDGQVLRGLVVAIAEERPAKGNWRNWDSHPDFYLTQISIIVPEPLKKK